MQPFDVMQRTMHDTNKILATLDLNLLRALDALLTTRSVSRAAGELGLSQPATSHALARLREALGDPLLVRVGSAMVATPRAEALAPALRRTLMDLGRLLADTGAFEPASSRRRFVLSCPDMLAPLLPELLDALSEAPGVDLELTTVDADADVVLGPLPSEGQGLKARSLGRVTQSVAMRPEHPALSTPWTVQSWLCWPHVVVRTPNPGPGMIDQLLAGAGLQRRIGLYATSFLLAVQVVASSNLLFTGPEEVLRRLPLPLLRLPPPLPIPAVPVAAIWPERLDADPGHRWFRERVVRVAVGALEPPESAA